MKILFVGGNGNISWYCVQKALEQGNEVWELNRGQTRSTRRDVQQEVHQIISDVRNVADTKEILQYLKFDVVCDFVCYNEEHAMNAIEIFQDITEQYIFISSEAVYKRISSNLPFKEEADQYEPDEVGGYIAGKVLAERVFRKAYKENGFPVTIVRPGYTYDTIIPTPVGGNCFTAIQKVLEGYPMIMLGDGTNLWSPMHSKDFANMFISLVGNKDVIGESYHITGEQLITWNEMMEDLLYAFGVPERPIIHIPVQEVESEELFDYNELTRQHMWHYIFDNSKIRKIAGNVGDRLCFRKGIRKTAEWLLEKDVRRRIDSRYVQQIDKIYERYWR